MKITINLYESKKARKKWNKSQIVCKLFLSTIKIDLFSMWINYVKNVWIKRNFLTAKKQKTSTNRSRNWEIKIHKMENDQEKSRCDCIDCVVVTGTILGIVGILTSILCGTFSFIFILNTLYENAAKFARAIIGLSGEYEMFFFTTVNLLGYLYVCVRVNIFVN